MSERYCVIEKSTGLIVNSVLLDVPEPETDEFRYVLCDGSAGIGWTVTANGVVPPVVEAPSAPSRNALIARIEALREQIEALPAGATP